MIDTQPCQREPAIMGQPLPPFAEIEVSEILPLPFQSSQKKKIVKL